MQKLRQECENEKDQLNEAMQEIKEKSSKELVDLEKERNTIQEEYAMLGEEHSELQTKLHKVKKENDQFQR